MRKRKYIHLYQCIPGDIIAQDIYDDHGYFVLSQNTTVNEYVLNRLSMFKVRQVSIYESQEDSKEQVYNRNLAEFRKEYGENVDTAKQMINDLAAGRKLDYQKVEHLTGSIYGKTGHNRILLDCMNEVKSIDHYTYTHCINVSLYAMLLARWLGLEAEDTRKVVQAGILHDIGKSQVPPEILNKKGSLLPEEFDEMKRHASIGYDITLSIPQISDEVRLGVLMHHEREDGSGYPLGMKGHEIAFYAKIISVADVYDALTSERVYKKRITPFDTFMELEKIGYGFFDTKVMLTFLANIAEYYIGSKVRMSNGQLGKVVFVAPRQASTPIVEVDGVYIDLSHSSECKIVEML
jgi:putative nucleotidyltransferase with HDIG domain